MLEVTPLDGAVEIRVRNSPPRLSAEQTRCVHDAWAAHLRAHPTAFDGRIVSLESADHGKLGVSLSSYSRWIAQRHAPALFRDTALRPLAVTGLLQLPDGIVFGRRSARLLDDAGLWELAPAGSLDGRAHQANDLLSVEAQLAVELREELNLHWREVRACRPFALIADTSSGVVDVALELDLPLDFDQVRERFAARGSEEYSALELVPHAELAAFAARQGPNLAAVSRAMLVCAGRLPAAADRKAVVHDGI